MSTVYGRRLYTGPFFATDTRYGAQVTPGNVEVPLVLGVYSADTVEDLVAVWFGIGGHDEHDAAEYDRARRKTRQRSVPALVYFDSPGPISDVVRAHLEPGDWVGIQAYPLSR